MFKTLRDSLKFLLDDDLMEVDLMEVAFEGVSKFVSKNNTY